MDLESSSTSLVWDDRGGGEEKEDDEVLWLLDAFLESQNERMLQVFHSCDSNNDGKIDKATLVNELAALGLPTVDLTAICGVTADNIGFGLFRDSIRVQLAFQKFDEEIRKAKRTKTKVEVIDYKKNKIMRPIPPLSWRCERDHCNPDSEWKAFMLQPRLGKAMINRQDSNTQKEDMPPSVSTPPPLVEGDAFAHFAAASVDSSELLNFNFQSSTVEDRPDLGASLTRWINVEGLDDLLLRQLAVRYQLDPLAIEDALQKEQRPKIEEYDHGLFIVVPMLAVRRGRKSSGTNDTSSNNPALIGGGGANRTRTQRQYYTRRLWSSKGGKLGGGRRSSSLDIGAVGLDHDRDNCGDEARSLLSNFYVETESVSIFVVEDERTVITVQEKQGDCWQSLRRQLRHSYSRVRREDHNFLLCKNLS